MHVTKSSTLARLAAIAALAFTFAVSGCKSAPVPDDNALNTTLQAKLASEAALSSEPIHTLVQTGVAILQGTVSSEAAKALAASDAAQIPGVKSVVNQLTVQTAAALPPPEPVAPPPPPLPAPVRPSKPSAMVKKQTTPHLTPEQAQYGVPGPADATPQPAPFAPIERRAPQPAQPSAPPPPPPPPTPRTVTVLSGTALPVRITQTLDSATTQAGDSFSGTLASDVMADGLVALPAGTSVTGRVDEVHEAGHFKGSSLLTISLVAINHRGDHITISTDPYSQEGKGRGANTAAKVGGGAAVGAILGGIFGGGKGAAIGAGAGGGLGAGAQGVTRGQQVQIVSETLIRFRLTNSVEVRVSTQRPRDSDANLQPHNSN